MSFVFDSSISFGTHTQHNNTHTLESEVTPTWNVGRVPNGGYLLALLLSASQKTLGERYPHPISATMHYINRASNGPCVIAVQHLKCAKNYANVSGTLSQNNVIVLSFVAIFGTLNKRDSKLLDFRSTQLQGISSSASGDFPEDGGLEVRDAGGSRDLIKNKTLLSKMRHLDLASTRRDEHEQATWLRFRDQRPIDVYALCLFSDIIQPQVMEVLPNKGRQFFLPTLELSIHFHRAPEPSCLTSVCTTRTTVSERGAYESDGELWDPKTKQLLATWRQIALTVSWKTNQKGASRVKKGGASSKL